MSAQILGPCPRGCGGTIMADGVCFLCARSVGEPVAEPKPFRGNALRGDFPDWSAKCNMGAHMECGGRRLDRSAPSGEKFFPCMCPHHREPAETKPRLAGGSVRAKTTLPGLHEGQWVTLKADGTKHSAHLSGDASLVGDPPIYHVVACGLWFPKVDLIPASEGLHRCKRCSGKVSQHAATPKS